MARNGASEERDMIRTSCSTYLTQRSASFSLDLEEAPKEPESPERSYMARPAAV